jgi:hypothetical protein
MVARTVQPFSRRRFLNFFRIGKEFFVHFTVWFLIINDTEPGALKITVEAERSIGDIYYSTDGICPTVDA